MQATFFLSEKCQSSHYLFYSAQYVFLLTMGKKIAFVHPDLGIGGAERLVVDAAVGLQDLGNEISIFTSHCDKTHCFEEVSSGILDVTVYGDFLPTNILKKFHILFAILRQFYLVLKLILTRQIVEYDYFIVDQLSFAVPLLSLFSRDDCNVLFYCHFPDQLLSKKGGLMKKLYRVPFNLIEEWTTGVSDQIVVNSNFTKGIFHNTFTRLSDVDPGVIYPCVDIKAAADEDKSSDKEIIDFFKGSKFFLSINRFERAKNIDLAIRAFAQLKSKLPANEKPRLVVAGGFDARVIENVQYLRELETLCESMELKCFTIRGKLIVMPPSTDVLFLPSIKSSLKNSLIRQAELLLYTPGFEHFGIVPVESMLYKTPVLAVNHGGPMESVVNYTGNNLDKATGFNKLPTEDIWSEVLIDFYTRYDETTKEALGENGIKRVGELFSREQMSEAFYKNLIESNTSLRSKGLLYKVLQFWKFHLLIVLFAFIAWKVKR